MISEARSCVIYSAVVLSLFFIDHLLGNGLVVTFQRLFCKVVCVIRKYMREERNLQVTGNEYFINFPLLGSEIVFLGLTIAFLNKYKQRSMDKIDDLLQESRHALQQTNEFLEKWRRRRLINEQKPELMESATAHRHQQHQLAIPHEFSYLDEEPQELKPFKLEVPILHMAIVDTLGSTRSRSERGDASDMVSSMDSMLLSMTTLLDDDLQSNPETHEQEKIDVPNEIEIRNRYLWDVSEEDSSLEEL